MSKFRIIEGTNVTSIVDRDREIRILESEINKKKNPTNRELVIFAYHFARLGNLLLAQKQLNNLSSGYYDMMIYKDLYEAVLALSRAPIAPRTDMHELYVKYDYFFITKKSLELFDELNFSEKPAFYRFRREFQRSNQTLTGL